MKSKIVPWRGRMALSTEDIYEKALTMSKNVEDNFLDLGRQLRQLQDREPELFQKIIDQSDLGKRKAYYLVEVSKTFDPLPISRALVCASSAGPSVRSSASTSPRTMSRRWSSWPRACPSSGSRRQLRGEPPMKNAHCVLMYFSPEQYEEFEAVLLAHGAKPAPREPGHAR